MTSLSVSNRGDSEVRHLRETVEQLKAELAQSKTNAQKVTDQLNCLVLLVRRAWSGDSTAASQVATVVGAAPPEILHQESTEKFINKVKSRPLQNWARLSLGLLNLEYQKLEEEIRYQQLEYLNSRQEFLNEQLANRSEEATFLTQLKSRPASGKARPASGKKVTIKHLYRNPHHDKTDDVNDMTLGDLVVKPAHLDEVTQPLQKLKITNSPPKKANGIPNYRDYDHYAKSMRDDYDDPMRYTQDDVFDKSKIQGKKKRPVSAVHQQNTDKMRSRPKSAVTAAENKQQRPLAFETTRPVSAQVKNKLKKDKLTNEKPAEKSLSRPKSSLYPKRPECVDEFSIELDRMSEMEKEFHRRTEQLQQKIGIPYGARI